MYFFCRVDDAVLRYTCTILVYFTPLWYDVLFFNTFLWKQVRRSGFTACVNSWCNQLTWPRVMWSLCRPYDIWYGSNCFLLGFYYTTALLFPHRDPFSIVVRLINCFLSLRTMSYNCINVFLNNQTCLWPSR